MHREKVRIWQSLIRTPLRLHMYTHTHSAHVTSHALAEALRPGPRGQPPFGRRSSRLPWPASAGGDAVDAGLHAWGRSSGQLGVRATRVLLRTRLGPPNLERKHIRSKMGSSGALLGLFWGSFVATQKPAAAGEQD